MHTVNSQILDKTVAVNHKWINKRQDHKVHIVFMRITNPDNLGGVSLAQILCWLGSSNTESLRDETIETNWRISAKTI